MEVGMIQKVDIDQEMQQSYLDYAMSVIVARALPDARDGLKPVQRRILYAMYDMGLRSEATYKKSARIVGEVLGKYHPHGDMAVYESMARLAQDFTMRYCLVDGQGNFGSVDGDPPAAMRYTEARLTPFAMELLNQIDRDTVDFSPNFDGTLKEPDVLPSAIPNLLVNGSSGIAVGMATNIPPHNLGEVVDALVLLLREWERMDDIAISDLMRFIQGPDLPTGGILMEEEGMNDLQSAYATGRGRVLVRGRVQSEDMGRGKSRLIVTELPYQVNKSSLIERIAELVREGGLEGISDLRDESDRQGMRIVIELNKAAETERVLLELYKRTPLQSTLSFNMLALVNGEPRLLSLKQALRVYLEHRLTIVKRRSEYDLAKAQHRLHILEGLRVALKNLDEVISLIRNAPEVDTARERLMKRFKLTEIQAQAILEMQLRRLASLERKKIELEFKEVSDLVKQLEGILKSPKKIRQVVEEELLAVRNAFADRRRTQIVSLKDASTAKTLLTTNDLTPAHTVWVGVMEDGHVGRTIGDALPRVSGKDAPRSLVRATTHHTLYLVAEDGRAAAISIESLPEVERFADGAPLHKVSPLDENDIIASVFSIPPARSERSEDHFVLTVSRLGMVKKSAIEELPGPSAQVFVLAKVNSGDSIGWAHITGGENELLLISAQGMGIRFHESEVRAMGLAAVGVNGIKLAAADYLVAVELTAKDQELLIMAGNGKAWRLPVDEFPLQGRYGQGVQICKLERGVKLVGLLSGKKTTTGILHLRIGASRLVRVDEIELTKRLRIGQAAVTVKTSDQVEEITTMRDSLTIWGEEKTAPEKKSAAEPVANPKKVKGAKTGIAAPPLVEAPKRGRKKKEETAITNPAAKAKPASGKTDSTVKKTQKAAPAKSEQKKPNAPRKTAKAEAQPALPLGKEGESKPQPRARKPRAATGGKEKGTGK